MIGHISQLQTGFGLEKKIGDCRLAAGHSWWVVIWGNGHVKTLVL